MEIIGQEGIVLGGLSLVPVPADQEIAGGLVKSHIPQRGGGG